MAAIVAQLRIMIFLYARISEDPRDLRRGVKRQMKDLLRWAVEDIGGEIAGEWIENDRSAHNGEERPEYDKMMAAALAAAQQPGVRVIVAAYHPSRLWRQRVERAQAIEDLRAVKAHVAFESGGHFNMAKASDRSQLANLGESDTAESEVKSERVTRAALERAEEGRANGAVAYGWKRTYLHDEDGKVIGFHDVEHPEQAAIVREIVKRLLAGDSLFAITHDLNKRGVPAPGAGQKRKRRALGQTEDGARWSKTSVKKIAVRRVNVGIRTYKGDEYPAAWPKLISDEQHLRVVDLFAGRADNLERPGQRMHLLSWGEVCTCGPCRGPISVSLRGNSKRGTRKPTYICSDKGCVGRNEAALDDYIESIAVEVLSDPEAADIFKGDQSGVLAALERAEALRIRQTEAADDFADGLINREQLRRITAKLGRQIAEAKAEAKRLQPIDLTALDGLIGPQAREKWPRLTVQQKRRALEALKFRVRIHPSARRGPGFDHTTLDIGWHGRELPA
ncbi:recombinase family protein [Streptomyces sp. NPDC042207]|uniref:recombinase family protein n=1 Tax=Streptomyces sp. NPDC042207 TaxID=3154331 RepID=UPI003402C9EB